jgi:HD-GYP domain-containing protein (c-di-GMP phosphodiesterase class II)
LRHRVEAPFRIFKQSADKLPEELLIAIQPKRAKFQVEQRLKALQDVSVELMASHDLSELLNQIVNKAVDLLKCDAGSLYLQYDEQHLVFEVIVNRSIPVNFERSLVPIHNPGLATHVFAAGHALRIVDVYQLPADARFQFDPSFDVHSGYRTRSALVQPLKSSRGRVLGVLQLINRKKTSRQAWPSTDPVALQRMPSFTTGDSRLLESFAAVASASIENATLNKNIEELFEGFVKASVHAIESRDLATRGHSDRVAIMTVNLAERVSESREEPVRHIQFSPTQIAEIRYASLLHDFGKIGVPEAVLQKEQKLSELEKLRIRARFDEFRTSAEIRALRDYLAQLSRDGRAPTQVEWVALERRIHEFHHSIESYWSLVLDLNQPTVLDEDRSQKLSALTHIKCHDCEGGLKALLEPTEIQSLRILRGSLSAEERLEIQSHVTQSYEFLRKIPWTRELSNIPEIAYAHHERLDGSGYPRRIKGDVIPVQAKIMAIADVYDALTANDRPYKPTLPVRRALEIIEAECRSGKLDPNFFRLFVEAKVYECPEMVAFNDAQSRKVA